MYRRPALRLEGRSLEPLMQLEHLKQLEVKNNRNLWLANEDKAYFEKKCVLFSM